MSSCAWIEVRLFLARGRPEIVSTITRVLALGINHSINHRVDHQRPIYDPYDRTQELTENVMSLGADHSSCLTVLNGRLTARPVTAAYESSLLLTEPKDHSRTMY